MNAEIWGAGSFDNDEAMDWIYRLGEAASTAPVREALKLIRDNEGEYFETPECCRAIAAAEVVAAMYGTPAEDLPDEVRAWARLNKARVDVRLQRLAFSALAIIARDSELRDLWIESGEGALWLEAVAGVRARLGVEAQDQSPIIPPLQDLPGADAGFIHPSA